jgi:hypothetical protein
MAKYKDFVPENVALLNTRRIGIYDANGNRVGQIPLGGLTPPTQGQKQYSFGALSDVHIVYSTAQADFKRALTYLNEAEDVAFTCICGDLTENGSAEQLAIYKSHVDTYSTDTPVYAIAGNHEATNEPNTTAKIQPYTGKPLYYSFTHGNDVFIMLGEYRWNNSFLFEDGELQWLYETLEANRNRRCFVFFHIFPWGDCGNANGIYPNNLFTGTHGKEFQSLMAHYKNVTLFHGHSHLKFYLQALDEKANYSDALGFRSVHIPSLAVPRDINSSGTSYENIYAASEGYVVDGYENGIHLRGRDFVKGEFLPIASYWLDTTLKTIPAGTYNPGFQPVTYSITNNLTNVTTDNLTTSINSGSAYTANLTPVGANITSIVVTMGGSDITSTAYSGGVISIPNVTGNIVITAVSEVKVEIINLLDSVGYKDNTRFSAANGAEKTDAGCVATGYIDITALARVRSIMLGVPSSIIQLPRKPINA